VAFCEFANSKFADLEPEWCPILLFSDAAASPAIYDRLLQSKAIHLGEVPSRHCLRVNALRSPAKSEILVSAAAGEERMTVFIRTVSHVPAVFF